MLDKIYNDEIGKLILRSSVGILMLFHGLAKMMHPGSLDFIGSNLSSIGLPSAFSYAVYIGEVIAPVMIVAGFHARVGAMLIIINMIFAVGLVHTGDIFSITMHGGWAIELQAFYLFGGLSILFLGSGKLAVKPD